MIEIEIWICSFAGSRSPDMAPQAQRSVSFPLSYVEQASRTSPFALSADHVERLANCQAFSTIRDVVSSKSGNR